MRFAGTAFSYLLRRRRGRSVVNKSRGNVKNGAGGRGPQLGQPAVGGVDSIDTAVVANIKDVAVLTKVPSGSARV